MRQRVALLSALCLLGMTSAQPPAPSAPKFYLQLALGFIKARALNTSKVNWTAVEAQAQTIASTARSTADTYPLIRSVIDQLGDHHSHFYAPGESIQTSSMFREDAGFHATPFSAGGVVYLVKPDSEAAKAGITPGDVLLEKKQVGDHEALVRWRQPGQSRIHEATLPTTQDQKASASQATQAAPGVVRLSIFTDSPETSPDSYSQYAQQMQSLIGQWAPKATCGWILDLRQDPGGSTDVQLLGLGPLLDPATRLKYVPQRDESRAQVTTYQDGAVTVHTATRPKLVVMRIASPIVLSKSVPPLAVLQSSATASAAEGLLTTLKGRPQTRFFGEPSAGVPTGNIGQNLPDGAHLQLTEGVSEDRSGHQNDGKIEPDVTVPAFRNFGTSQDPAMLAAVRWLHQQCKQSK